MIIARPLRSILYQGENATWTVELFDLDGGEILALQDETAVVTLRIQRDLEDDDPIVEDEEMTIVSDTTVSYDLAVDSAWRGYYCGQITVTVPGIGPGAIDQQERSALFSVNVVRALGGATPPEE